MLLIIIGFFFKVYLWSYYFSVVSSSSLQSVDESKSNK